jgi:hypothetical protein
VKKSQFKLFYEILDRFQKEGILKDIILIGHDSWADGRFGDFYLIQQIIDIS